VKVEVSYLREGRGKLSMWR